MPGVRNNVSHCTEHQTEVVGTVAIDTVLADAAGIDYRRYGSGNFTVPTGSTITTLTWHTSHEDVDASYVPAYTDANVAVTQTVAETRRYPFPAALAGAHYIRATGNADGTITNVVLKS